MFIFFLQLFISVLLYIIIIIIIIISFLSIYKPPVVSSWTPVLETLPYRKISPQKFNSVIIYSWYLNKTNTFFFHEIEGNFCLLFSIQLQWIGVEALSLEKRKRMYCKCVKVVHVTFVYLLCFRRCKI